MHFALKIQGYLIVNQFCQRKSYWRQRYAKVHLLLANCNFMSVTMANRFDITEELVGLCEKSNGAVQKDYLSDFELTNLTHSGVKYVSNSLYWLYRCLANYAKDSTNYETIADVIVEM